MRSVIERNFRDTTDKMEIEMKEVKEKLSSLTASAEKSTQEGWLKELLTKKKLLRATLFSWVHNATDVDDDGNRWMSANTAYFGSLLV